MFNEHEVTRSSLAPFHLRSPKRIKSDYSGDSRQRVYQAICKTAYTPWQSYENQGLSVLQSIFPNAMFGVLRLTRRQTRLPMDQGLEPNGVSQYIRDGTGSTSPYWKLSIQRGGITQPLLDNPQVYRRRNTSLA